MAAATSTKRAQGPRGEAASSHSVSGGHLRQNTKQRTTNNRIKHLCVSAARCWESVPGYALHAFPTATQIPTRLQRQNHHTRGGECRLCTAGPFRERGACSANSSLHPPVAALGFLSRVFCALRGKIHHGKAENDVRRAGTGACPYGKPDACKDNIIHAIALRRSQHNTEKCRVG